MARTELMSGLQRLIGRRTFLKTTAALAASATILGQDRSGPSVGIVGAGLAGLACADALKQKGIASTIYEAGARVGGRQFSLRYFFPGQTAERGGEFIDTSHKTMLGYAQRFKLAKEDVKKVPGELTYYFNGQRVPEADVVAEFRDLVSRMQDDLRRLSPAPTADSHNDADVELDRMSLTEYLDTRRAGPLIRAAVMASYVGEYGLDPDRQSCLNFLMFIHADRRSKFTPFGVFSDERYHIIDGNDRIAQGLAEGQTLEYGMQLVRAAKTPAGRIELTFRGGAVRRHDAVVLAVPFSVLREVELNLGLPDWKVRAIRELGYGTNSKLMVGLTGRPWTSVGGTGECFADLPNVQGTWETNPVNATESRAILTDYTGGALGASLDPNQAQAQTAAFLKDLDKIFPGSLGAATRDSKNRYVVDLQAWPKNPLSKGSYTCYLPGQFTSIAGNEGKPVGNVYFAGEHANSFYEFQGFMEGAALSGLAAADQIWRDFR